MNDRVFFQPIAGKRVFCVLSQPSSPRGAFVIMSHGFKGTSVGPAREFVDFSRLLVERGFAVLRFDQPCSGNSEGDFIDSSFTEWVRTIVTLARTYRAAGHTVCLLGQSMGATATMVAAAGPDLLGTIPCVLLWVPDPVVAFTGDPEAVYEEEGQPYRGTFWAEATQAGFFAALGRFDGAIHVVYGERDAFISAEQRHRVMGMVHDKGGTSMVLPGQGHSSWGAEVCQMVYKRELAILESVSRGP